MTPSPTPSEGEAMRALAKDIEESCDSGGVLLNETEADMAVKALRAAAQSSSGVRDGREIHRAAAFLECASSLENYSNNYGKQAGIALRLEAGRMRDAAVLIRKKYDEARTLISPDTPREGEK